MGAATNEVVIPKQVVIPPDHHVRLEVDLPTDYPVGATEVTLIFKAAQTASRPSRLAELSGKGKGKVWIADDFDAPVPDFAEYS